MKYIKLFEAFDSSKLSKTLAFINKESRKKFISMLKSVTNVIDFPVSKLSDEYFQYLSFSRALNLNYTYENEPCDATSKDSYPDYYVPGSSCVNGHVDRKWGKGIRSAICTKCQGTGIKPRKEYEVKWIKFWFDKDGNYITSTLTDGKIRSQSKGISESGISLELKDYEIEKDLTLEELTRLETGTPVYVSLENHRTVGIIWKSIYGSTYIIQNDKSGDQDRNSNEWRKFGNYSWIITSSYDYGEFAKLLKPKDKLYEIEEPNPYTWNAPFDSRYGQFNISNSALVDKLLSNAHFAIVMNFLDLKKSSFKPASRISSERGEIKSGAFKSDDEFRNINLQNYISTLIKNAKLPSDIENLNQTIIRFIGGAYAGIYILRGRSQSDLNDFITHLYRIFNDVDKENNYRYALEYLRSMIEQNLRFNRDISSSINEVKVMINKNKTMEYLPVLESILDLNSTINDKIKSMKFETIEDIEIVSEKIRSIRNVWRESDRLRIRDFYYIVEHFLNPSRAYSYMEQIGDIDNCLEKMKKFKNFVERL